MRGRNRHAAYPKAAADEWRLVAATSHRSPPARFIPPAHRPSAFLARSDEPTKRDHQDADRYGTDPAHCQRSESRGCSRYESQELSMFAGTGRLREEQDIYRQQVNCWRQKRQSNEHEQISNTTHPRTHHFWTCLKARSEFSRAFPPPESGQPRQAAHGRNESATGVEPAPSLEGRVGPVRLPNSATPTSNHSSLA